MSIQLMRQPSSFIDTGIQLKRVRGLFLLEFTECLQEHLSRLNEKQRAAQLTPDETVELAGILELDRVLTLINAKVIASAK